jgi:hypothetical protein
MSTEFHYHDGPLAGIDESLNDERLTQLADLLASVDSEMAARLCLRPQWLRELRERRRTGSRVI